MSTVYKVEIVIHWTSFTNEELQKLLENAIKKDEELKKFGNEITVEVQEQL